jgi:CelD/BcsL family acetyltransferase involved in cellulose biosynthesis
VTVQQASTKAVFESRMAGPASSIIWQAGRTAAAVDITIQVLNDVDALPGLSSEWEQLWRQTPEVSAFQALEWILACARHEAHSGASCFVTVLRAGHEPLAIFPTQLSARGALSFIGAELSNYCGPVYLPDALPSVVTAWRDAVSADPRIQSIDLAGLRERSPFLHLLAQSDFPRWGKPVVVEMFTCPEVDLHEGWDKVFRRHKSRQRANWRRKWDSLAELGRLEFLETNDPGELAAVFPRVFELYHARWRGKRIGAAFGPEQYRLQLQAAKGLGTQRLVRLSLIRLDGEVFAFAYAMRGLTSSTSYVLAHDAVFEVFSPGLLLLIKLLEAAAARGDACYDFSLGAVPYKTMWATGEQRVFSVLLGSGAARAALKRRWWRAARSIPLLRKLKQEGLRGLFSRKDGSGHSPDRPGLSAGTASAWHVYRIIDAPHSPPGLLQRPLRFSEMRALFSPRLLALALDRHYRGDQGLAVERNGSMIGAIWMAAQHRRSIATGGFIHPSQPGPVYYHPVAAEGEDLEQIVLAVTGDQALVVCPSSLERAGLREIHTFLGDLRFRPGALSTSTS